MNTKEQGARDAYLTNNIELSKKVHNPEINEEHSLKEELKPHSEKHVSTGAEHIKSAVYGGLDGIITTYSVVMGVLGANLSNGVVLTLGIANVLGDGISMALGDYISSKSENEFFQKEKERETWEVENNPEGEIIEMVELYKAKGIQHDDAIIISQALSKNKDTWIDIMMVEELGLSPVDGAPWKDALVTFVAFLVLGIFPLLPFIVAAISGLVEGLFVASTVLTAFMLFMLGAAKSKYSYRTWYSSGLETLFLGACTAGATYLVGWALEGVAIG